MTKPGAAIIGAGCICAAGANLDACMDSMLAGNGAPTAPTRFRCEQTVAYPVFEVNDDHFEADPETTRSVHLLVKAMDEALDGLSVCELHVGVCIGTSVGASLNFLDFYRRWKDGKQPSLAPIHRYLASNPAEYIAKRHGFCGPCQTVVNACTSGADAIGIGMSWIGQGLCDIVVAGGTDELNEISYNGFARLMITSPDPCRPFDADRKGLNLGEGAAVLVLASDDAVRRMRAFPKGHALGYGTCGDAHHLTAPHPEARGLKSALNAALVRAGITDGDIDFINVHGTGTPTNDQVEGLVIRQRFPDTLISTTKGFTGHTLGAAGAIEAAFTLACLERGSLPPGKGFARPDPAIGVEPVTSPTRFDGRIGLSQSLAFGGNNSVLILEGVRT